MFDHQRFCVLARFDIDTSVCVCRCIVIDRFQFLVSYVLSYIETNSTEIVVVPKALNRIALIAMKNVSIENRLCLLYAIDMNKLNTTITITMIVVIVCYWLFCLRRQNIALAIIAPQSNTNAPTY